VVDAVKGIMRFNFSLSREVVFDTDLMLLQLADSAINSVIVLLPFFGVVTLAALIGPTALGGFIFSGKAIAPKFSRMDPLKGLARMFSVNSLVELVKSIAKVLLVGSTAYMMLVFYQSDLLGLAKGDLEPAIAQMMTIIGWSVLIVSASMILVVAIDVPYQIFDHSNKMKMTFQEVREEMKDTEGKPEVKGRIRQMQRQLAQRRMMSAIPEADVVITNPEHFSVALKYDVDGGGAPIVVAKGVDFMAMKIREVANAHGVMILPLPPLARSIYFTTEVDQEIPSKLYLAVAQVLAYIFQLRAHKKGQGKRPKPLAEIELPREVLYDSDGVPQPEH
jgi:flagellar biosynthetic protein FlhB